MEDYPRNLKEFDIRFAKEPTGAVEQFRLAEPMETRSCNYSTIEATSIILGWLEIAFPV